MNSNGEWSGQQLAEFLELAEFLAAVSASPDECTALAAAVERVAGAVDAEVAAVVRGREVVASVGFPDGRVPADELGRAAHGEVGEVEVPGTGRCTVVSLSVDASPPSFLVVARSGDDFAGDQRALLRSMARVLSLGLRTLRTLEEERASRARSERQAEENARLVTSLQQRQALMDALFRIQRSISHRAPISVVLDAITTGAAELLGDPVVAIRLLDPDDQAALVLVSSVGLPPDAARSGTRGGADVGIGAQALRTRHLVVTHDYPSIARPLPLFVAAGVRAAMAAPVFQDGRPIGILAVGSRDPERRYEALEQEMLRAFAEHASLALNDASALEAMRKAYADALHLAHHDTLTGLPNRSLVLDRLEQALARRTGGGRRAGVLFVDLDRFKRVNDTLGHAVGDEVLMRIGERLQAAVRPADTVGRLAGDEFVVVCDDVTPAELLEVAERLAAVVAEPFQLYGRDAVITASIGVAHRVGGGRAEDVLRDADVAMYRAKERGRARIEVFDERIRARLLERLETEHALRRALRRGELRVHYQPVVRTDDGQLTSFEALLRWQHPERGLVAPGEFVPLAEETGLIVPIGRWVLREACAQLRAWREAAGGGADIKVAVNLSARQLTDPGLAGTIAEAVDTAGVPADALIVEITESVLIEEVDSATVTLRTLKNLGVNLSVDDFGTGYSSLSYLKRLPVDILKVDRVFVGGLGVDAQDGAIVSAVVTMAHALGLTVVAEGVETACQLEELRRLRCDGAQGFLLGRPEPARRVAERWLAARRSTRAGQH